MTTVGELLKAKGIHIETAVQVKQFNRSKADGRTKKNARDRRRNRNRAKADLIPIIEKLAANPGFVKATWCGKEKALRELIQECVYSDGYDFKFYKKNWWKILIEATRAVVAA